jgi:hypothetical protein
VLGLLAVQAFAQEATIVGTVTDPSGATIPNAAVTTVNTLNSQVNHYVTSSDGQYVAPGLQVGHYTVRVEVPGFKKAEQKDIVLNVGDRARADFKLEIGSATESVTVEASPVAVQTESGEVSDVITSQQVTQLSVNGRSVYGLTALMAGASSNMPDVNTPTAVGGNATVSYNGNRSTHNIYLLDGGEDLDRGGSGTMSIAPSIDALGEFRTLTSNYGADFGLSSAATFTMVLKSGTKDFHASGWEFLRNEDLDSNTFLLNQAGKARPVDRYNVYGFNVGGPVFIPKVYNKDKNKTFFFYNQEWRKIVSGGTLQQTVPLASEYGGNFGSTAINAPYACAVSSAIAAKFQGAGQALSGCTANAAGQLQPDKGKLVAFNNNTIPTSLLDANAQAMLKAGIFPSPTSGSTFSGGNNASTNVREEIVRIDHHFTDKFWLFGHWVDDAVDQGFATTMWAGANVPSTGNSFSNPSYSGVIHATYTISPTLLNEVAFNYNGNRISILPTAKAAAIANRTSDGVKIPMLFPSGTNLDDRIPAINLTQLGTDYTLNWVPWTNKADDYQVRDDFSWTKGNHQIKFGASYALYKKLQTYFADTEGQFGFNGQYTGSDFADYLLGMASSYSEDGYQGAGHWDNKSPAIYVQDNWKVSKKLTVNLALRWDGIPHTYEESNNQSNFYPNLYNQANRATLCSGSVCPTSAGLATSPIAALSGTLLYMNGIGIAGQNGIPAGLVKDAWHNFGPRIGFAYDPVGDGKTVIRGGFGMMYERIQGNDQYNGATNVPFGATASVQNVSLSNPGTSLLSGATVTAPIPIVSITGDNYSDYKPPVSIQYNFGVQRELAKNTVLSLAYVGTANRHQNEYTDINNPDPSVLPQIINGTLDRNIAVPYAGYGGIKMSENDENGHYNSLQATLHTRVSKDLTLEGAFTYSKSMDPGTGGGNAQDMQTVSNPYDRSYDYGPSALDRRAVLVTTFVYDLPILRGNSGTPLLRATLGGWEVSGIVTAETGMPLNITLGGSEGSNGLANGTNRPNVTGSVNMPHSFNTWFDPTDFSSPTSGAWGTLGHNAVYGPGRDNWNISLFKSFTFSESRGSRLEIRAESFNTFNHTQYNGIGTSFASGPYDPDPKKSGQFGMVTSVYNPRNIQLGVKLMF